MSDMRPRLNAEQIAYTITHLEQSLEIDHPDWSIGDMHLWPLYRMEIYRLLFASHDGQPNRPMPLRRRVGPAWRRRAIAPASAGRPHDVWLISDGISFARFGTRDVERFCTPLHEVCERLGHRAVLIDRYSPAPRSCNEPYRWCAPATQRAKIAGTLAARLFPDRRHDRIVQRLESIALPNSVDLPSLSARHFDAMSRAVLALARPITASMKNEAVRAAFVVGYYDVGGYAHLLAAARAGAVSVDVQHGVTGSLHMGYAGWNVHPAQEFRLLPRVFWNWSASDAAVVEQWAEHGSLRRRAIVGGHPFLQAWRSGRFSLDTSMIERLERLRERSDGRPAVLVTLQPGIVSKAQLAPLLDALRAAPDVAWWLRLHPLARADGPLFEALLREQHALRWDIETASELPLPALLTAAAVHATHSSSVVIEAQSLGVPSIVWSCYGAELFDNEVKQGRAHVATTGDSFVRLLGALRHTEARPQEPYHDAMTLAMQSILERSA